MRKALEQQSPDQFLRYCVTRNYQDTINQLHAIADHIARYLPPHFDVDHERLKPGLAWQCCQHGNLKVMRIQWCCQKSTQYFIRLNSRMVSKAVYMSRRWAG